jgi:hypothetical protein
VSSQSRERIADKLRYAVRATAFERVIQPFDEWTSLKTHAGAWLSFQAARRVWIPVLGVALYAASRTNRPLAAGAAAVVVIAAAYRALSRWARKAIPERAWPSGQERRQGVVAAPPTSSHLHERRAHRVAPRSQLASGEARGADREARFL